MWSIIVCDQDETEREQILTYIRRFGKEKGQEAAAEGCGGWQELYDRLEQAEPDVLVMAQNGVEGLDILTSIHLPSRKFIWISDLDFSLQAYRLGLPWFGKKPVTYKTMAQGLARCMDEAEKNKK